MRTVTICLLLALLATPCFAGITQIAGCSAASTSCTPSNAKPGDVLVAWAFRNASTTAPTLPAGWTSITTASVGSSTTSSAERIACKIATTNGAETATGFTNATDLVVLIFRGTNIYGSRSCGSIGTPVKASSTGTTSFSYPAVTLTNDGGASTSWVAGFIGIAAASSGATAAPTGMTNRQDVGSGPEAAGADTNGAVSSWTAQTVTGGTSVRYLSATVEINAPPAVSACTTNCPTLVQYVHTASNALADTGNGFKIVLPNPTLSGNALLLGMTYPHSAGRTISATTDKSDTFTLLKSFADASNLIDSGVYCVMPTTGAQTITVTFDTALSNIQFVTSEFAHVNNCTADGTPVGASTVAPGMAPGAITTTQADDLVYQYGIDVHGGGVGAGNLMTGCFSPVALISCERRFPSFQNYYVAHASGSTSPNMIFTGAADEFNDIAIALKNSSGGTLPSAGIRIVGQLHTVSNFNSNATDYVYFPTTGNLIFAGTTFSTVTNQTLSITTDTVGNTWTSDIISTSLPQSFHAASATASNTDVISVGASPTGLFQMVFYDVAGADTSPFVSKGSNTGTYSGTGNTTGAPTFTPSAANELIFAVTGWGTGPPSGLASGGVFDSIWYTGETDASTFDNGDGYAHFYTTNTSAISFDWTMANGGVSSAWNAVYVEFKPPASASVPDGSNGGVDY